MKIVVCGNYGAKNLGDELILEGLIKYLRLKYPQLDLTVMSANPAETEKNHKVKAVPHFSAGILSLFKRGFGAKETKEAIKTADLFILGGGGLFGKLSLRANIIWGIQAFWAYHLKKPVHMLGQSIGPLKSWIAKRIVKKSFSKAEKITVRDFASKERLANLGIENVQVEHDFAFNLKPAANKRSNKVIIALRAMKSFPKQLKQDLALFVDFLSKNGRQVEFIDFQLPDDNKLHKEIIAMCETKENISHCQEELSSEEILEKYSKAHFAFAMRLHSVICALITDTPFLAINYANKVEDLLKTYNKKNFISPQKLSLETLSENYKKLSQTTILN